MGRHVLLAQNGLFRPQASAAGQSRAKGAYSAFSACCKLILAHSGRYMPTTSPGKYRERRGMLLPITLTFAATAALLNLLLAIRVSRLRRSEEHTSELQSLMRISYAVFCLKKK